MKKSYSIREAHLQLCHWVHLLSQPTTTWSPLHWEFENPPCNFNVAKTNAILRISLFTMNSRIKETHTVLRFEKGPSLEKRKKHEWLSWKSVISSASQSSQIHNITAPPEEMLFRCLERRLNLNLMLGPGLPQKASIFETMHFHRPLSCGQRCVDVNNIIKICWEGNQQLLKGCKNHFHGYWKHVRNMSFFCLCIFFFCQSHGKDRGWLAESMSVCPRWMLKDCPPPPAKGPVVRHNLWLGVNGLKRRQATAVLKHLVAQAFHVAFEQ